MEEPVKERGSLSPPSSQQTPRANQDTGVSGRSGTTSESPTLTRDKQLGSSPRDHDSSIEIHLMEQMEQEKTRYPGASNWAPAEEHLFEILYMRQDLPMLPPTWDIDFSATMALMRLIDLTSRVRTNLQTGFRQKVPGIIKRELDKYLSWAAQDGDYAHLRIVPNIVTEVIDTTMPEGEITEYLQDRMRVLARLQREFLRVDRDPQFWDVVKPSIMVSPRVKLEPEDGSPLIERWSKAKTGRLNSSLGPDELATETPTRNRTVQMDVGCKRLRLFPSPTTTGVDELAEYPPEEEHKPATEGSRFKRIKLEDEENYNQSKSPSPPQPTEPETPSRLTYSRHPPVVYGLFILNTTVLLLTIDASQGDSAYVSFHVQANFQDQHQSIWNALTVAIAVCLARDELMTRTSDFEDLPVVEDSDPDA
ncbi:hypothetical protein G7Z17_g9831 [Cylindrodendrum hubeiense]|uniref:Uncharacterized protein n=1 Tax=Cylindrodendrum hubeiense TaxID=595255 RepID=A0A9P5H0P5_9HYPO|nr:hypothetical protein G7Z17_g9831 [Cylindrodendrum hubeiense]